MSELPGPGEDLAEWVAEQWSRTLPELPNDATSLAIRLDLAKHAFDRSRDRALRPWQASGIRGIEDFRVVSFLRHAGDAGVRLRHLADYMRADGGTMSRRVARLDDAGLVERFDDPSDGRSQRVRLVQHHAEMVDDTYRALADGYDRFFAKLSPAEQQVLYELLTRMW